MGIFTRGINKGAYRGTLNCPVCRSEAIRYVENIGRFRQRYRCRKCGMTFQYDISNSNMADFTHPYAPFKKRKWQDIVENYNARENLIRRRK